MPDETQRDLVALVADKSMRLALQALLSRPASLGIRPVSNNVFYDGDRDPGCRLTSGQYLRPFLRTHRHAIVLFDREGCGRDAKGRTVLEAEVEARLNRAGWGRRARAVVIDPEFEIWIWSGSPHVDRVLGWTDSTCDLRDWLVRQALAPSRAAKPAHPKRALQAVLGVTGRALSGALFQDLATRVSLARCTDPAFLKLKSVLQAWFPAGG